MSDEAANTTTVPEMLGVPTAADAELAGAVLAAAELAAAELAGAERLEGAPAADDVAAVEAATDAVADVAADDVDDAVFFDELQPARASATATAVTTAADAWRFIDSPRGG